VLCLRDSFDTICIYLHQWIPSLSIKVFLQEKYALIKEFVQVLFPLLAGLPFMFLRAISNFCASPSQRLLLAATSESLHSFCLSSDNYLFCVALVFLVSRLSLRFQMFVISFVRPQLGILSGNNGIISHKPML